MRKPRFVTALILCCAFTVTIVTGGVGWTQFYADNPDHGFSDALYRTLLAFTGDGGYVDNPANGIVHNPWIEVARFAGLLTTISAIAGVAIVLLGERIARWRAGWESGHTVLIGASAFALEAAPDHGPLTVIDDAETLARLPVPNRAGRTYLIAAPEVEARPVGPLLGKPARILFGDRDSAVNVERARIWQEARPPDAAQIALTLRIEEGTIARDLRLISPEFDHATLISRSERVARALVTGMAPTALALTLGQARPHVALIGMGSASLAIAEELALRTHHPRLGPLRLTIIDSDLEAARGRVRAERPTLLNPELGQGGPEVDFLRLDALQCCAFGCADELIALDGEIPLTALVVASGDDTCNTAIAMRLRQLQTERLVLRAPIFMRSDALGPVRPASFDDLTGEVVPFGGRVPDARDRALERFHDDLARAMHDRWRDAPDVVKTPENDWRNMGTATRRASHRAALFVVEMFHAAGFTPPPGDALGGLRLEPGQGGEALENEDLLKDLMRLEHARWNTERRLEGYRSAKNGIRDDEKRRNPLIVAFDELPEGQEDKDRGNIVATLDAGIARGTVAPHVPCWRTRHRVGVIGPLIVDPEATDAAIASLMAEIGAAQTGFDRLALEILTPNAPGFDREAAIALATQWKALTGRPAALLLMNAARPVLMDRRAAEAHAEGHEERNALRAGFEAQTARLEALSAAGHDIRRMDLRPAGVSDADLNPDRYLESVRDAQEALLSLADRMIFDRGDGTADWTERAIARWTAKGGAAAMHLADGAVP